MSGLERTLRRRWWILLPPATLYFVSYFHRIAPGVVAEDLMRDFGIGAAALGTLAAIYPYVFVAMALVGGSLADTLGPRLTLAGSALGMGLGALVFGQAPVFQVAVVGRLLVGLGASVCLIAFLALAAQWVRPDEFATVSGLSQAIGNLGGLVAAAPLALLVEAIGWRGSFGAVGALTLALGVWALLVVRDRPQALGLPPVDPAGGGPAPSLREVVTGIPQVVRNARTWPPILAAGVMYASLLVVQALWGVPYLMQVYGLSRVAAAGNITLVGVGLVAGAPLVGRFSDRWLGRRRRPFVVFAAAYAVCWLPLALPGLAPPAPALPLLCFALGFTASGLVLVWSCVREVNDPARVGVVVGVCNAPIFLLFALLQWITGLVLDAGWSGVLAGGLRVYPASAYRTAFGICFILALAGVALASAVTETRCRNIWAPAPPVG
ncbi:MAG TPA: MFS transporter [Calidithermus sp.]|nr:MFS transporter [Calidithermus sp.]